MSLCEYYQQLAAEIVDEWDGVSTSDLVNSIYNATGEKPPTKVVNEQMNNDEVLQEITSTVRTISSHLAALSNNAHELFHRLERAECDAFTAGGVNDSWAVEVDRLTHLLHQSTNYIADRECGPTSVRFNNGRIVKIVVGAEGPYLDVSLDEEDEEDYTLRADEAAAEL